MSSTWVLKTSKTWFRGLCILISISASNLISEDENTVFLFTYVGYIIGYQKMNLRIWMSDDWWSTLWIKSDDLSFIVNEVFESKNPIHFFSSYLFNQNQSIRFVADNNQSKLSLMCHDHSISTLNLNSLPYFT
jgi:hypothetical protein